MKHLLNSQGSYWRKWDLHIHSPASVLNSEYRGDWEKYICTLENLKDISVIGITDYYSIEGYKRVKQYKEAGRLQNIDLVLPNIEMRLNITTYKDRPINIHIIFSPEVDDLIETYFLQDLEFEYQGNRYKCIENDLITLGERFLVNDFSKEKALYEGMKQFKVSLDELKKVLKNHENRFKDQYIVVIPNSSVDGNSGNKDDSFRAMRNELYHFAHAIFSSSPRDRQHFLGEGHFTEEQIIKQYGKLMPCLHGSDAHNFDQIGNPSENRFMWIKAEPSFEGLLQILYEPKNRVVIQQEHPDQKYDYDVISSVKFDHSDFIDREIKLNPGLNAIIGGKSSGKSLLLYKIAQAVSYEEIGIREQDNLWKNPYKDTFIEKINFEVKWRNGEISKYGENKKIGNVTYIPQMYINALSEDTANQVLQGKIREILFQDEENKKYLEKNDQRISGLKQEINRLIIELFENYDQMSELKKELEKIGKKETIQERKRKVATITTRKKSKLLVLLKKMKKI
ncbi:hypothetical protein [Anoxybacillus sp. KU2-6(11)]|uniref:hypothetical protein n=1 Tax=Anoxybacillus sp. KU2-6(11) TaxID=1535751 RepID=UPI00068985C8|nr:hypothetical protein [Anoxybacillus sp. KU2-6(11)]